MFSTLFRDPQARSSAPAALGTLQPRAFGSLYRVETLDSSSNYYLLYKPHCIVVNSSHIHRGNHLHIYTIQQEIFKVEIFRGIRARPQKFTHKNLHDVCMLYGTGQSPSKILPPAEFGIYLLKIFHYTVHSYTIPTGIQE